MWQGQDTGWSLCDPDKQPARTRAKAKHIRDNAVSAQVYVSPGMLLRMKHCPVSISDQSKGFGHYAHYFAEKKEIKWSEGIKGTDHLSLYKAYGTLEYNIIITAWNRVWGKRWLITSVCLKFRWHWSVDKTVDVISYFSKRYSLCCHCICA